MLTSFINAQERIVKVDFESGSFFNNPNIPFSEPFMIIGGADKDIEFVKVNISFEGKKYILHSFVWNRCENNQSETFNIVVPPILRFNTKYDFEVITYKMLPSVQKEKLLNDVQARMRFLLTNNIYFNGKDVVVNNPNDVYNELDKLIIESFKYFESKNAIQIHAPSSLVLEELKRQSDYRFSRLFRKKNMNDRDEIANKIIFEKVEHLVALISSELTPFLNSQVVQHDRQANIKNVKTDNERYTLPVNIGMYAWNKTVDINNTSVSNINFTPGAGLTIPFVNKGRLTSKTRIFDSFGFSAGVLFQPVIDNYGTKFVTPGVNLPVYTSLGLRVFKVVRFNAGLLVIGEKGNQDYNTLLVIPTVGLALELNLWMGVK
jgi:hypothetical protein